MTHPNETFTHGGFTYTAEPYAHKPGAFYWRGGPRGGTFTENFPGYSRPWVANAMTCDNRERAAEVAADAAARAYRKARRLVDAWEAAEAEAAASQGVAQ